MTSSFFVIPGSIVSMLMVYCVFCDVSLVVSGAVTIHPVHEMDGQVHTVVWEYPADDDERRPDNIEQVIDLEELRPEDAVETLYDLDNHHRGFVHNFRLNNTINHTTANEQEINEVMIPKTLDDNVPAALEDVQFNEEGFPVGGVITSLLTFVVLIFGVFIFVWIFAKKKSACVLERRDKQPMYNPLQMEDGELPKATVIR